MSALGGKVDMTGCGCLLSRSLLGVKRTWAVALHVSAYDPKRTFDRPFRAPVKVDTIPRPSLGGHNEAARFYQTYSGLSSCFAVCSTRSTGRAHATHWHVVAYSRG